VGYCGSVNARMTKETPFSSRAWQGNSSVDGTPADETRPPGDPMCAVKHTRPAAYGWRVTCLLVGRWGESQLGPDGT
jgi:hypothetical protein